MPGRKFLICFALAVAAIAQVPTGTITGRVSDVSGAVVPSAAIKITNVDTGIARTLSSNEQGLYTSTNLPTGNYRVETSSTGFQPVSKIGLVLSVDQTLTVNFDLSPGELVQSVDVVARAAQLVQTASSSLGQVIDDTQLRDLPLNGRNFHQLIGLAAGSVPGAQGQFTSTNFHINGGRGEGNGFLVDGVDVSSSYSDPVRVNPSLESIGEFKVLTNSFSAEYGRSLGGVITVRTKGGTNQYHGNLFHFFRNRVLDARNFFAAEKPPFQFNQFGGSLGGPIVKDKAFFFGDYQGSRIKFSGTPGFGGIPTSTTAPGQFIVPDLAQRGGDFSSLLPGTVIYDPLTSPRVPFPGNRIPSGRFDPAVASIISLLPAPNQAGPFNYSTSLPSRYRADAFDTRVDYHFNQNNFLSSTFNFNQVDGSTAPPFGRANGFLITPDYPHNRTRRVTVTYTRLFGASTVNELVLGYSRDRWFGPPTFGHEYDPDLGIRYLNTSPEDDRSNGLPLFIIPGLTTFGGPAGAPFEHVTNIPQIADNFSWVSGPHSLKTGFTFKARQFNMNQSIFPRGLLVFNPLMTSDAGRGGHAFASALLGYPLVGQRDLATPWGQRTKELGFYFQDDWKTSSRLTLNLGVRYDLFLPATEQYDRLANFDPVTKSLVLAGQNGLSSSTLEANTKNFGPHVGFAYLLTRDQRTVLRGGYGLAYLPLATSAPGTSQRLTMNPPFRNNFSTVFSFLAPTVRVSDGLLIPPPDLANPSGDIVYIPAEQPSPYMQHWNFNIQRAIRNDLLVDVAYAGSRGVHLTGTVNLNQAPPGPTPPATRAPISSTINNLVSLLNRQSSIYHSLQAKLERRFASGFSMLASYTFSKSIDDGSYTSQGSDASSVSPQDSRNWRAERGVSDFDVTHRLIVSYIYELPFGKGRPLGGSWPAALEYLAGGWQVNGITVAQSGSPFTPVVSAPRTNAGPGGAIRPDRISSGELSGSERTIQRWFDKSAFLVQGAGGTDPYHFGNSGRNILRGPQFVNFDFSLFKEFALTERSRLQFRAEFFNLFNTPNFNLPSAAVDIPQGGVIASARDPRQIQLALKLLF